MNTKNKWEKIWIMILIVITSKNKSFYYSRVIPIVEDNIGEAINSLNNTFVIPDIFFTIMGV